MQKPLRYLAGAAMMISAGLLSQPAGAIGLPGAQGVQGAVEDGIVVDKVHCRPGWWHHGYRPHDGCFRGYRYYNSYSYYPGYYGYGPGFYGPGISFGFGVGRFGHHRRHW
jgi:hypothetical protein